MTWPPPIDAFGEPQRTSSHSSAGVPDLPHFDVLVHHGHVLNQHATSALTDVQKRLQPQFPQLEDEVVEAAIRVAYSRLSRRPGNLPVTVEHAAKERLIRITDPLGWP